MNEFKAPDPLKSEERELAEAMTSMITLMSSIYRNQVILELDKGTVAKFADRAFNDSMPSVLVGRTVTVITGYKKSERFDYELDEYGDQAPTESYFVDEPIREFKDELFRVKPQHIRDGDRLKFNDAQTGNYAVVLTKLSKRVQKKLLARFDDRRIQNLSKQILAKNDKRSKQLFYERVSKQMGIDPATLMKKDGMTYDFNALVLENTQWVKKLRDETLELFTANTLRSMAMGDSIEDILAQYDGLVEKRKGHAEMVARTQINTFNSIMNKSRAQKLGIKKAVWLSSGDERARPSHDQRDGKEFDLSKGLYSSIDGKYLLPGVDYQCRCNMKFIFEEEEE